MLQELWTKLKIYMMCTDEVYWNLFLGALATLFAILLGLFITTASGCDDDACCYADTPCVEFDYSRCPWFKPPMFYPVPVPTGEGNTDSGGGNPADGGVEDGSCVAEEPPQACEEHCLTPFGKCVSECVKEHGANKYGRCVQKCRKEQA